MNRGRPATATTTAATATADGAPDLQPIPVKATSRKGSGLKTIGVSKGVGATCASEVYHSEVNSIKLRVVGTYRQKVKALRQTRRKIQLTLENPTSIVIVNHKVSVRIIETQLRINGRSCKSVQFKRGECISYLADVLKIRRSVIHKSLNLKHKPDRLGDLFPRRRPRDLRSKATDRVGICTVRSMVKDDASGSASDTGHRPSFKNGTGTSDHCYVTSRGEAIREGNPALGPIPKSPIFRVVIVLLNQLSRIAGENSKLSIKI